LVKFVSGYESLNGRRISTVLLLSAKYAVVGFGILLQRGVQNAPVAVSTIFWQRR